MKLEKNIYHLGKKRKRVQNERTKGKKRHLKGRFTVQYRCRHTIEKENFSKAYDHKFIGNFIFIASSRWWFFFLANVFCWGLRAQLLHAESTLPASWWFFPIVSFDKLNNRLEFYHHKEDLKVASNCISSCHQRYPSEMSSFFSFFLFFFGCFFYFLWMGIEIWNPSSVKDMNKTQIPDKSELKPEHLNGME